MSRRRLRLLAALLASAGSVLVACSSSDDAADVPPLATADAARDDATSATADAAPDAGGDAADAARVDAALPPGHGASVETSMTPLACDAVCAAKHFTCGTNACETLDGAFGLAAYMGGTAVSLACADTPAPATAGAPFVREDCCCITPFVLVDGPATPKACSAVCTARGLACDDAHDWGKAGKGGLDAQYERPSTTAVSDLVGACTKVPSATIPLTKPTEQGQLTHYRCACILH
jgi:hypothetical protein